MTVQSAMEAPPFEDRPRFDEATGQLVGGRCVSCDARAWPRRAACHRCGGDLTDWALPIEGVLETWSRVWVPLPGVEPPYVVGIARFDGTRVFVHVDAASELSTPAAVRVVLDTDSNPFFRVRLVGA